MDVIEEVRSETDVTEESPSVNADIALPPDSSHKRHQYVGDKWTTLLAACALAGTLGFAVPAGYSLGVLNTPVKILQNWCNVTLIEHRNISLNEREFDILWSLIVSVFLIGGVIGGLTGAWFAERLGRKGTLIVSNALNLFSGFMFFISKYIPSVELFFTARVFVGFVAGLMTTVVPMYLTEVSPPKLRGVMGVSFPVGLTFGILLAQIMGLNWILGTAQLWPLLVSFYIIFSLPLVILLPMLPESPKYLYGVKKEEEKALSELARLRDLPRDIVAWELIVPRSVERRSNINVKWNLTRVLQTERLHLPLALVIALQAGQQFSGINAIFYYSANIFEKAGIGEDSIPYATIGTGVVNFCMNLCSLHLVHNCGRRPLLMISCFLTSTTLILLALSIRFLVVASWMPYLSVLFVLAFVLVFDLGLGPIPYFIGSELVDTGPRPVIMALGSVANWGGNFLIAVSYTTLYSYAHEYIFLLFAVCILQLMFFIKFFLPETRYVNVPTAMVYNDDD